MIALSRRQFLGTTAAAFAVSGARAVEPIVRKGPARLRLSLAAYSFRQYFRDGRDSEKAQTPAARQIDLFQFIDFCAEQGCDGTELTSYYFPKDFDDAFLLKLRHHAFIRGVSVSGTAVGNTFTLPTGEKRDREIAGVKRWIEHAKVLGAPHIRVFAGNLEGQSLADAKRNCIVALEECADTAGKAGVFLGIENHGGIVADPADLLDIIKSVRSPWVGINLDSGNFHSADPYADLVQCVPYAVNVQVKVEIQRKGAKPEPSDLPKLVKILSDARYQGWVALEYESAEDPWVAVPRHLKALGPLLRAAR
jgi:sugar phosphate isomerase/epimerase